MSEGMSAGKVKAQNNRYENLGRNDNQVIKGRVESINKNYAKKLLLEIEGKAESRDFIEEILKDSFIGDKFSENKFYEILVAKEEDGEINIPSFRKLDSAVIGKIILVSKQEREFAN